MRFVKVTMGELDYQMALLLQHRFDQEYKSQKNEDSTDYQLARHLQEQFEAEATIETPSTSLVYDSKKQLNSSKSLTDPSWELVDPTPDIHMLFMAFNEKFFWNKLLAVCVSWSKRMTSCAGVCSYNGRGGMCSITLSEPLLKLRPRKDLIETLLHEMIHAYLFVTHNNKDREGHGPEFHKHMYRINKESGTNITVYHSFHDEVRLYQQHWWRCDGPCQNRKPFFGMVRRATNRAPGPNDFWWAQHSASCGGTFIKVKEPEKTKPDKKSKPDKKTKPVKTIETKNTDIRNFIPSIKNNENSSNIKGLKDVASKVQGKYNSSSTVVVTKNTHTESTFKPTVFNSDSVKERTGNDSSSCSSDFLAVRNHWANKFGDTNKRPSSSGVEKKSKIPKICDDFAPCPVCDKKILMAELNQHLDVCLDQNPEIVDLTEPHEEMKECPLCSKNVESSSFDSHVEKCVTEPHEEMKECPLCSKNVESSSFDSHVEKCVLKIYDGIEGNFGASSSKKEKVACLACGKDIFKEDLSSHLDDCMNDMFKVDVVEGEGSDAVDSKFNCPFCMKLVKEEEMKAHLDSCLVTGAADVVESLTDDVF